MGHCFSYEGVSEVAFSPDHLIIMAQEIEIKLLCRDEKVLKEIFFSQAVYPFLESKPMKMQMEAYYLDTSNLNLSGAGYAFRLRREGHRWVAAIKRRKAYMHGLYDRDEWEKTIPFPKPDFEVFSDPELKKVLKSIVNGRPLIILCEVLMERICANVIFSDGTMIEVAADKGEIHSYGLLALVSEVELELKSGAKDRLVELSENLKKSYPLVEGAKSKYERGLNLFRRAVPEKLIEAEGFFRTLGMKIAY